MGLYSLPSSISVCVFGSASNITCKDDPKGHGRREKERQTEREMGRYNIRMDRIRVGGSPSQGWGQIGMEKSGCPIILDAPTVIQTTG